MHFYCILTSHFLKYLPAYYFNRSFEISQIMTDFFSPHGPLAAGLAKFEPRDAQKTMAEAVARTIDGDESDFGSHKARLLVVEAETGIGKTLAYLIPAILSGKRIVVSTATLNLQDQIMNKEVPLLSNVLGREVPAICIKGRQNYLCRYRWYQHHAAAQLSLVEDSDCKRIESWLRTTETGDRAELDWLSDRSGLWFKVSAQSNQCLGGECPEAQDCFVNRLRKKAGSASLMVVNHHLFFSDLALRQGGFGEVLPRYEGVIFDEAHHLENVATTFFGKSFSQYQLLDFFSDILRQAETDLDPDRFEKITGAVRGLRSRTEEFVSLFPIKTGKFHLDELVRKLTFHAWQAEVELLATGIERVADELKSCAPYGEGWNSLEKRGRELRENLLDIALPPDSLETGSFVYWYERRERSVALSATPVDVASHLQQTLYSGVDWCVMTSATLSSAGDFSYMKDRLGLDDETEFLQLKSPFDYKKRTLLYVPEKSFPEPAEENFQAMSCRLACELLQESRGRGLVLCTSFRGMESMADYLERNLDHPLLVQGHGSRNALLQKFRDERDSVLVAVASFWEGVDVPGDSLTCVIIDKLPFEVPTDPVIQARVQAITERGGKPFFDFQVPRAVLSLRQGVGRLMRTSEDWGIIAILDVRLYSKGYGAAFRKSLPPSPVVRSLKNVRAFFDNFQMHSAESE